MKIHHLFKTSALTKSVRKNIEEIEGEMNSLNRLPYNSEVTDRLSELRSKRLELEEKAIASVAFDLSNTQLGADLENFSKR